MPICGDGGHAAVIKDFVPESVIGWIIAIGDNATRQRVSRQYDTFEVAIHPKAIVSYRAEIGEGTVIMAGAIVQARAKVGRHCIINTAATVDHDCIIEDFAHIAPGVHLCGGVRVGEGALVGVGSCATPGAQIAPWSLVKAGSVVTK